MTFLLSNSIFHMLFVPSVKVHLEISPDSQHLTSEEFNKLKVSNALRYEVLTEILTSLDINCRKSRIPPVSPVHLLATDQVGLQPLSTVTLRSQDSCLIRWDDCPRYTFLMLCRYISSCLCEALFQGPLGGASAPAYKAGNIELIVL